MTSRFDRQVPFLTIEGQRRLEGLTVAIVGVGGLGCHLVEQFSYLGVGRLVLVDDDAVDITNLNRLVYATPEDLGNSKVDVAVKYIARAAPAAQVSALCNELRHPAVLKALRTVDVVFGCVDHDGPRFVLSKMCAILGKRYTDLASDIAGDRSHYGGRVVHLVPGNGCLSCWPAGLDPDEVREYLDSPEGRRFREDIYGQSIDRHLESGPAVVSINGVVASIAVTEFLVHQAGIRDSRPVLNYMGHLGSVTVPSTERWNARDCRICSELAGSNRDDELQDLVLREERDRKQ